MEVILKVDSLEFKVRIASSVLDVMTFINILKKKGPHLSRSGTFMMFQALAS